MQRIKYLTKVQQEELTMTITTITTATESDYAFQSCSHKWTENAVVAERAENVWEKYVQIIDFWKTLPNSKQLGQDKPGANKSYHTSLKKSK